MQFVPDMIVNAARRFPQTRSVTDGERSHTFADTHERATRLAAALRARGLARGDRVALLAVNEIEYTEIQVACQRGGFILVPLNYRLALPELAYLVDDSAPRVLIAGAGYVREADRLVVEQKFFLGAHGVGTSYDSLLDSAIEERDTTFDALDATAACTILYTSGTTGRPKGAVLTNLSIWARQASFSVEVAAPPGSRFLQCLPMFHIASNLGYHFSYTGSTNVFLPQFDAEGFFDLLESERPTHILLVPTMINMLLNHPRIGRADFSSVEMVLYGASSIAPAILKSAIETMNCGFLQFFGMTETSGCSILRPSDHDPERHPEWLASCGTDAIGFETRVVDDADDEVDADVVGEIVTRGPGVMSEYWRNPDASDEAMRNGWMHTGDLGVRSVDGYIYITDRKKDMVVSGGENVYPREVEDALYSHPDVFEVAVIGVPDERWGERVHAVVVLHDSAIEDARSLSDHARERLATYKIPRTFDFVDELPKNVTGKILKTELRSAHHRAATLID
ncbi:class I adenylate-forming enzyme family protein [Ilumatobacter sp.]|uniref:class I adenylate-forming enzyme family protein n=1 Tax=Ilumatobacter sp. TaxID=1967498 RepID=UPI003B526884